MLLKVEVPSGGVIKFDITEPDEEFLPASCVVCSFPVEGSDRNTTYVQTNNHSQGKLYGIRVAFLFAQILQISGEDADTE